MRRRRRTRRRRNRRRRSSISIQLKMANFDRNSRGHRDDRGPLEEGGRVKTKPVSCSTVGGGASKLKRTSQHLSSEDEDESPSDPPAPRKASKIGFGVSSQTAKKANPISIKLGANKPKEPAPAPPPKKLGLASVFNEDDDSEPEEMPPEAKMRMKNIGRETPTSAGPNSFNKGKQGFSDNQKLWERKLKAQSDK
ncbi:PEST proteolytic signal-containing nuclear protein-like [Syngnathoides biaculeatus]|uniref:PEST proteolytic signal-containing nuclear protein-like n=1 Tax=Syngnathoides biaculeatus TaxID=300417 RepID=UPI002ADD8DD9|nr:PEST proteolytic signal-containing nuclear protein-like [Syngnathoides biaculeatus]